MYVKGTYEELEPITKKLQVERTGAYHEVEVQRGLKPPYDVFYSVYNGGLVIPIGLTHFLGEFGVKTFASSPEFTMEDVQEYLGTLSLPFVPYRHQIHAFYDSLLKKNGINILCTGSGKSMTIALLADFFRTKGKKGLLIVPNINLLTQFKSDIADYNLMNLYNNTFTIGGGQTIRDFSHDFTISTWQSLMDSKDEMDKFDYILIDETHRAKGIQLKEMIEKSTNADYKLGFTGTLNDNPVDRMTLFGLFGAPKTYIRTQGLIELGLATPVEINAVHLTYSDSDRALFRDCKNYPQRLQFIKEHQNRNNLISKLSLRLASEGNTLVLFQHTEHGKELFRTILQDRCNIEIQNKDIVGKKAFEFQSKHHVYFINGEVDGKVREQVRKILDDDSDAIIVASYPTLSTGVNIKNLHNMIFASPMKAFTTITQSIGRGIRLHDNKTIFKVYDLCDKFTTKGIFMKQYFARKEQSYDEDGFPVNEIEVRI